MVEEIGETCNMGVLEGRNFVYLERVETTRMPRIYLETGSRLPSHVTSGGKVLLAYLPAAARARLLKTLTLDAYTENTITSTKVLEEELLIAKSRGYAVAVQEFAPGIIGIGVPILNSKSEALASLAMHAPIARVPLEKAPEYVSKLQIAAAQIAEIWDIVL